MLTNPHYTAGSCAQHSFSVCTCSESADQTVLDRWRPQRLGRDLRVSGIDRSQRSS